MVVLQSRQKNFLALAAYLAWGETRNDPRHVAWTAARNLPTDDPELAAKFMRATAAAHERLQKPVHAMIVAFASTDRVNRDLMERIADRLLEGQGLGEHQALLVGHRGQPRQHFHIMVNRVHPDHHRAWSAWHDWLRVMKVARELERTFGLSAPEFGRGGWTRLRARLAALASDVQTYERVTTLTRERYEAQLQGAPAREARTRTELRALPDRAELERRIGGHFNYLWPFEIRRIRAVLTAPQFALAKGIGRASRSLARSREEEREHSR